MNPELQRMWNLPEVPEQETDYHVWSSLYCFCIIIRESCFLNSICMTPFFCGIFIYLFIYCIFFCFLFWKKLNFVSIIRNMHSGKESLTLVCLYKIFFSFLSISLFWTNLNLVLTSEMLCWYKIFFSSISSLFTKQAEIRYFHLIHEHFFHHPNPHPNPLFSATLSDTQTRFVSIKHFFPSI